MEEVRKITEKLKSLKKSITPKKKPRFQKESDLPRSMRIDTTTSITGTSKRPQASGKTFNSGGEVRGSGAAVRGTGFKGVF